MIVYLIIIILSTAAFAQLEDQIFDQNVTTAEKLLDQEYEKSKVLFIGLSYHSNHQHIIQLTELIKRVGLDPNLKTIVLERAGDISGFYEMLSTTDLKTTLENFQFESNDAKIRSLCAPEWAFAISYLFPELRRINKLRPTDNPLLVKTIDGMRSTIPEMWPGSGKNLRDGTCSAVSITGSGPTPTHYGISGTREQTTAQNFKSRIWSKLEPDDKAIVLYHRGHIMDNLEACQPNQGADENDWVANKGLLTWFGRFMLIHPEARQQVHVVVIDEKASVASEEGFNFTQRQSRRTPNIEWAITLAPFNGVITEIGIEMFTKKVDFRFYLNGAISGTKTLPEIVDGLISNPLAHVLYRTSKGYKYLPDYCPVDSTVEQ